MTEAKRFCPKCGARVEVGDAFCVNCGAKLDAARTTVSENAARSAGSSFETAGKRSPKRFVAIVTLLLVAAMGFYSFTESAKSRPARNYDQAAERAVAQLEQHDKKVYTAYDITRFEGELSAYKPSEIAQELMSNDVLTRLFKAVCRYDGDPRHGERLGLTACPDQLECYLIKSGSGYSTLRPEGQERLRAQQRGDLPSLLHHL